MSITIHLPADTEEKLRQAASRRGQTLEHYLQQLAISSAVDEVALPAGQSVAEWIAEWRAWAASHTALPHVADDSRESIYEGRGE
jgi:predicted transcriptional regulator